MTNKTHIAIVTPSKGGGIATLNVPSPFATSLMPNDVLVKIAYAGVNHIDISQFRTGTYMSDFPFILGKEWSGHVLQVGSAVKDLSVGDQVIGVGYIPTAAAWQEIIQIPRIQVARFPANHSSSLTLEAASTIPHTFAASFIALFSPSHLRLSLAPSPAENSAPILIWGAASACGIYAIQLLRLLGYTNIIGVAATENADRLVALGAKVVLDRNAPIDQLVGTAKAAIGSDASKLNKVYVANGNGEAYEKIFAILSATSLVDGGKAHISYIIRVAPASSQLPTGVTISRALVSDVVVDKDFGAVTPIISTYLETLLETIEPARKATVFDEGSLLERVEAACEASQDANGSNERMVVKIA